MNGKFTHASVCAAVGLLTAELEGIDIEAVDLIGDTEPEAVAVALTKVAAGLLDVLAGQQQTNRGLRAYGRVFAEEPGNPNGNN